MQPQERFVPSACNWLRHTGLGTVLGTLGAFFDRFVRKTEGKRDKATVFQTVAFAEFWREIGDLLQ